MTSLTHHDAVARAARLTVHGYDVRLDLTADTTTFTSRTTARFASRDGLPVHLDVRPEQLRSATLDGRDVSGSFDAAAGRLTLDPLPGGEHELVVDAVMEYSRDGEGLHRHVDPADGRTYLYAMSFLDAAPRWFACFDQPDLKAPVGLDVRCPSDWVVAGNGPATAVADGHWRIEHGPPLATYFTTLVAGPFHAVHGEHDGIPLTLLARRSLAEHLDRDADELFAHTAHCFDELHRLFGVRYGWPTLTHAFVPEFNAGAMENPGCITYRDQFVFRSQVTDAQRQSRKVTMAHEMAHLWFGDLVTMRWWDDLWLNESFAEYLGNRVVGDHAWAAFGIERKSWGHRADQRPSTHPVAGNGAPDAQSALAAFDGISYAKGASALRQLAVHLGDDAFLAGLRAHVADHAFGNADFADLVSAWNATGTDVTAWADAWLRTTGLDTLRVEDGQLVRDGSRPHTIDVAAFDGSGREQARHRLTVDGDRVPLDLRAGSGGLVLPDVGDATWAKIGLPTAAWERLLGLLHRLHDPLTRVAVWNALQLAVADAELDPVLAAQIAGRALPFESDATISAVGRWALETLAGAVLSGRDRAFARRMVFGEAQVRFDADRRSTDPLDPGRRLALVRLAIAACDDETVLRAWLAGDLPSGLELDDELRWELLRALAALGSLSAAELDAASRADRTSQGLAHAAWCRAARPDADAKAEAWTTLMTDPDCGNYELYALAQGFWRPGQETVTDPYVERYFAELPAAVELRSGWVADRLALFAYPWCAVTPRTLELTGALLDSRVLPPGAQRSVVDAGDDLRRALAVRPRFLPSR
ncbi:M1 family aminopeptidase [Jatrophihabitans fulvus]